MGRLTLTTPEIDADFTLADSSLTSKERKFATVLGDDDEPDDFFPQVEVKRWLELGDDAKFSMRLHQAGNALLDHKAGVITTDRNKVTWSGDGVKSEFQLVTDLYGSPAMQWTQEIPSRPLANNLRFTIVTRGLVFHKQPLVPGNDREGNPNFCPDEIKGSYAVYHAAGKKGNGYETGKAFNLYRPKAIDALLDETWCDISINEPAGLMDIDIPARWLNSAVYPIRIS